MKKSRARFVVLMVSIAAAAACTSRQSPAERSAQQEPPSGNRDALDESALKEFRQELADYVALHKKLESTLAPLPTETSPEFAGSSARS